MNAICVIKKIRRFIFIKKYLSNQWCILGEANEAVASGPPRKYLIEAHFAVDVILGIIMKLGRKVGNRSSIRREDLFFVEITMILGEKRKIPEQSHIFFREHQFFRNPCLGPLTLNIPHCIRLRL